MPFAGQTLMAPRNLILDGSRSPPHKKGHFCGGNIVKYGDYAAAMWPFARLFVHLLLLTIIQLLVCFSGDSRLVSGDIELCRSDSAMQQLEMFSFSNALSSSGSVYLL